MKESFVSNVIAVYTATGNSLSIAKHIKNAEIHFVEDFLSGRYTLSESIDKLGIDIRGQIFEHLLPVEHVHGEILRRPSFRNLYIRRFLPESRLDHFES